jgi:tetratricopeptide (TPR) repeat protein
MARHVVEARIEQAWGNYDAAVEEFAKAVDIQDSLVCMEPPYWYYPVSQSLGAALLQAGRPAQAEAVFRQSLDETPNNGWGTLRCYAGASRARVSRRRGKDAEASRGHLKRKRNQARSG